MSGLPSEIQFSELNFEAMVFEALHAIPTTNASPSATTASRAGLPLPPLHGDVSVGSQVLFTLREAAASCEGGALGRLALNTSAACDELNSTVIATIDGVSVAMRDVRAKVKRLQSSRDKRLEWLCDEFDANTALLESIARQLRADVPDEADVDAIVASFETLTQLLSEGRRLPTRSSVVMALDVFTGGEALSRMQLGVDPARSTVSHPPFLKRNEGNVVVVTACDAAGDVVGTVREKDVCASFTGLGSGWTVRVEGVEYGTIHFNIAPGAEGSKRAVLCTDIAGTRIETLLQVSLLQVSLFS